MATRRRRLPVRNVVPDRLDLRDRTYQPPVGAAPRPRVNTLARVALRVRDQGDTNACTGFALAATIDILMHKARRAADATVSPFMLYSMARRYDEFPGYTADDGSSVRGALKAWYRHGACREPLWPRISMPKPNADPRKDWWQDAARRPLGAYYRVDTRSVTDMQVALDEVGVLYASVVCHAGWDEGFNRRVKEWIVPQRHVIPSDGGHAICLAGYDDRGFVVLNSWGEGWGAKGVGILTYDDWLANAMDCWVAQLGVPTEQHFEVARAASLRIGGDRKVSLASDVTLRDREISPFIVDLENNGALSGSGRFRTQDSDLVALVNIHLKEAIDRWQVPKGGAVDVALYAHGGLVGEESAADTAARWIPALYDAQVFPVFVMWETDILSTLRNRLVDLIPALPPEAERRTAGIKDQVQRWLNQRLERTFAEPGAFFWNEMKQNADALSGNAQGGLRRLFAIFQAANLAGRTVRFHLVGHSAGAIVHSYLASRLIGAKQAIDSVTFLAPAVRTDVFAAELKPHIGKRVRRFAAFVLDDATEQRDPTCRALLGYGRSLLYLVSESFETSQRHMPILGMAKFAADALEGVPATLITAPGEPSGATTHGGFDDDARTMASVIRIVKHGAA